MAQIKAYDAGNLKLQPTEIGVESTAAAGRREGAFFNQQGAALQELGRDQGTLGRETGQLGSEVGQFSREVGHETATLGTAKARALTSWGQGVGNGIAAGGEAAVNYQTHKEVSAGSKAFADFGLAKTRELNDTLQNADPNNPSTVQNFMDGLNGDLDKLRNGFNTDKGQQWAEQHIEHMRSTFQAQVLAGTSTLAKKAVTDNNRGTLNSLSATAYENPAALPELINQLESSVVANVASSPYLKGVDAVGMHGDLMQKGVESLVKSAVLGHISKTGQVPEWLNSPQYSKYVNGAELQMFAKTAQVQQRTDRAQQKAADLYTRQQANERAEGDVNKTWIDNVQIDDVTGQPTIKPDYFKGVMKAIQSNPDSPNASKLGRTYLNWGESQLKRQNAITDPELKAQFMDRIGDPDNPLKVTDLMEAQLGDHPKLSNKDFGLMKGLVNALGKETFKDQNFKNAMDAAKSQIGTDPKGKGLYANFAAEFMPQYAQAKRAGTLPPNALNTADPKSMISQAIESYKRTYVQYMTDKATKGMSIGPAIPGSAPTMSGDFQRGPMITEPPAALPAASERKKGQTYPTARGQMEWTGTGWIAPSGRPPVVQSQ